MKKIISRIEALSLIILPSNLLFAIWYTRHDSIDRAIAVFVVSVLIAITTITCIIMGLRILEKLDKNESSQKNP